MKYNHFLLTLAFFMSFTMLGAIWVGVMSLTNSGSGASIVTLMLALPVAATLVFLVNLSRKAYQHPAPRPRSAKRCPLAAFESRL
jgi:hypothetical protein